MVWEGGRRWNGQDVGTGFTRSVPNRSRTSSRTSSSAGEAREGRNLGRPPRPLCSPRWHSPAYRALPAMRNRKAKVVRDTPSPAGPQPPALAAMASRSQPSPAASKPLERLVDGGKVLRKRRWGLAKPQFWRSPALPAAHAVRALQCAGAGPHCARSSCLPYSQIYDCCRALTGCHAQTCSAELCDGRSVQGAAGAPAAMRAPETCFFGLSAVSSFDCKLFCISGSLTSNTCCLHEVIPCAAATSAGQVTAATCHALGLSLLSDKDLGLEQAKHSQERSRTC